MGKVSYCQLVPVKLKAFAKVVEHSEFRLPCCVQGATSQVQKKRQMLQSEGVSFDDQDIVAPESVMSCKELKSSYSPN